MKQYGFRVLDRDTRRVAQDFAWFPTADEREAVILQAMIDQQHVILRDVTYRIASRAGRPRTELF
jgi:hypothetical protein